MAAPYGNKNAEPRSWGNDLNAKQFKSEKEYQQYIEDNIKLFCEDVLQLGKYVEHRKNTPIEKSQFSTTRQKIDLYVVGKKGAAIVELKNPVNYFCEIRNAISQLLYYSCVADNNNLKYNKLCLVSPVYDERIFQIIVKFNLPIHLYYLSKEYHSEILIPINGTSN